MSEQWLFTHLSFDGNRDVCEAMVLLRFSWHFESQASMILGVCQKSCPSFVFFLRLKHQNRATVPDPSLSVLHILYSF